MFAPVGSPHLQRFWLDWLGWGWAPGVFRVPGDSIMRLHNTFTSSPSTLVSVLTLQLEGVSPASLSTLLLRDFCIMIWKREGLFPRQGQNLGVGRRVSRHDRIGQRKGMQVNSSFQQGWGTKENPRLGNSSHQPIPLSFHATSSLKCLSASCRPERMSFKWLKFWDLETPVNCSEGLCIHVSLRDSNHGLGFLTLSKKDSWPWILATHSFE